MFATTMPGLLIERIGWLLVHSTWQFAFISLVVAMLLAAMQRAPVNLRYRVLMVAWAAMVAAPLVTWLLLPESSTGLSTSAVSAPVGAEDTHEHLAEPIAALSAIEPTSPAAPAPAITPSWSSWQLRIAPWLEELVSAWCVGMLLFALRPAWSWYIAQRLRRHGLSAVAPEISACMRRACEHLRIRQQVQLWQSARATVPMVVGYLHPLILLPMCATSGLPAAAVEAIIVHELAHIRRHDYLVNLFQTLMETAFFYHPAVWWLSSAIRREREYCCDELAAETLGSRAEYGRALLALEELRGAAPVLSLGANGGSLLERIRRLATSETGPQSSGAGALLIVASVVVIITDIGIWSTIGSAGQPATTVAKGTPTEAELPEGVVGGVTVDADGHPVPGARVTLRTGTARYTETDAEGKFRFENVPPYPRQYVVWAYAGNLVTPHFQVEQAANEATNTARFTPLRLEMREGQRAKFQVNSAATGEPIPRASIRFGFPDRRQVWTAEDGTAIVEGLLAQQYDVTIEAESYARDAPQLELIPSQATTEYKADLMPGGVVRGVVVDQQSQPIRSVNVVFFQGPGSVGYHGDSPRTDGDGKFQHRFLPLGTPIEIAVYPDGFLRQKTEIVLSAADREVDLQFKLEPQPAGRSITGVVQDSNGNPVPRAKIANYGNNESERRETLTGADGSFKLENLIEVRGPIIYITADGFGPQKLTVPPGTIEPSSAVMIRLEEGHSIRGKVVDENDLPLSGVFISPRSNLYHFEMGETYRTSADGGFAFDSLPADVRFTISHPDYPSRHGEAIRLNGSEPVILKLEAPGMIRGEVVDAGSGEPLPQFRIQLGFSRDRQPGDRSGTYNGSWSNPGITFNSGDGQFLIKPLQAGMPLELRVIADGYERLIIPRVVSTEQNASELLRLRLNRLGAEQRYKLAGQLLDHAGRPAAGAQVRLIVTTESRDAINNRPEWRESDAFGWDLIKGGQLATQSYCDQYLATAADADGRFAFDDILPERFLLLAYWGEGVPQGRSLAFERSKPGASNSATIRLPEPAVISGTIERANFQNVGSVRLLQDASRLTYELDLADEQTTFMFHDVPPGEYSVVVYAKPVEFVENGTTFFRVSPLASLGVDLQPGETKQLRFTESNIESP